MGPVAEKAVIKQLDHKDKGVKVEACRILKEIGTKESTEALQKLAQDRDKGLKKEAEDALKAISQRA